MCDECLRCMSACVNGLMTEKVYETVNVDGSGVRAMGGRDRDEGNAGQPCTPRPGRPSRTVCMCVFQK